MATQLLVMSKAMPGAQDAYLDWYRDHHLPNMVAVPGVAGGAVHKLAVPDEEERWSVASKPSRAKSDGAASRKRTFASLVRDSCVRALILLLHMFLHDNIFKPEHKLTV